LGDTSEIQFQITGGYTSPNNVMNLSASGLAFNTGVRINTFLDEDDFASDSDVGLATQQSIKAYVDGAIATSSHWSKTGTNLSPSIAGDDLLLNTGETLSIADMTQGSVPFFGASGLLSQDNNNLFWDNTNSRLGIGTNAPASELHIVGSLRMVDGNEGADKIMVSDANGTGSWKTNADLNIKIDDLADGKSEYNGSAGTGSSVFLGEDSGAADNGTNNNVGVGVSTLEANISGSYNTAFGRASLFRNTSGSFNAAYGAESLFNSSTGNNNTANGYQALFNNTTGDYNTALGYRAGFNANGTANVFIGNQAGYNETTSNKLYIENTNASATNALLYGEFGADASTTGNILRTNSEFQIGDPAGTGYQFPVSRGTNNQILQTNGIGALSWVDATSVGTDNQNLSSSVVTANETVEIQISDGTNTTINIQDADADATNELQTLSISDHDITLSNGGGTVTVPSETTTNLSQNTTTGVITYTNEDATNQTANVVSTDSDNQIEAGNDGGAYLGPTVYTGFFIISTSGSQSVTGIPFQPSQVTFVAHINIESTNIDNNNGTDNTPGGGNDRGIDNSFGTMNGFGRNDNGTITQQVISVSGHGNSINNISRYASSSNCIGVRYGNQNGRDLGKITAPLTSFNSDGFTINVTYTLGTVTVNNSDPLKDVQPGDVLNEGLVVLYTAYK
jgi:hypothetical protein